MSRDKRHTPCLMPSRADGSSSNDRHLSSRRCSGTSTEAWQTRPWPTVCQSLSTGRERRQPTCRVQSTSQRYPRLTAQRVLAKVESVAVVKLRGWCYARSVDRRVEGQIEAAQRVIDVPVELSRCSSHDVCRSLVRGRGGAAVRTTSHPTVCHGSGRRGDGCG